MCWGWKSSTRGRTEGRWPHHARQWGICSGTRAHGGGGTSAQGMWYTLEFFFEIISWIILHDYKKATETWFMSSSYVQISINDASNRVGTRLHSRQLRWRTRLSRWALPGRPVIRRKWPGGAKGVKGRTGKTGTRQENVLCWPRQNRTLQD